MTCTTTNTGTAVKCATFWQEPTASALAGFVSTSKDGSAGKKVSSKPTSGPSKRRGIWEGLGSGLKLSGQLELERLKAQAKNSIPAMTPYSKWVRHE